MLSIFYNIGSLNAFSFLKKLKKKYSHVWCVVFLWKIGIMNENCANFKESYKQNGLTYENFSDNFSEI